MIAVMCDVMWEPMQVIRAMQALLHVRLIDVSSPAALTSQLIPARSACACRSPASSCLLEAKELHPAA